MRRTVGRLAGVSQVITHDRRYPADVGVPALLDSDAVADGDVMVVGDHGDAGAAVQSYRMLHESLVVGTLIGDQPAEQSAPGCAGELLVT